jgi:hypothetical protein
MMMMLLMVFALASKHKFAHWRKPYTAAPFRKTLARPAFLCPINVPVLHPFIHHVFWHLQTALLCAMFIFFSLSFCPNEKQWHPPTL